VKRFGEQFRRSRDIRALTRELPRAQRRAVTRAVRRGEAVADPRLASRTADVARHVVGLYGELRRRSRLERVVGLGLAAGFGVAAAVAAVDGRLARAVLLALLAGVSIAFDAGSGWYVRRALDRAVTAVEANERLARSVGG